MRPVSSTFTCPKCGASFSGGALAGLCPNCVGRLAFVLEPDADPAATPGAPQPLGAKLRYFGDYELFGEIARGGMGVVYKARQVSLNRIVAVKMILAGKLASAADVARFRAEAEAAANLRHPNIVAIHEVGEQDGQHYFSMDYVEGESLAQLISDFGFRTSDFERAAQYVKTIAEAIHYAHQQGTLHRDLKPSNVLIDDTDQPRITDFGLAKRVKHDSDLTVSGQILGTPNFMSPEQAGGKRGGAGPQSDVYSLGAILYFLLTGKPPFAGETVHETLAGLLNSEPATPRSLNRDVPRDLETICLKCLEKEPRSRYASAKELADDLDRFLQDRPILARPIGKIEWVWRRCRRHPVVAALVVGLLVAVAALLSLLAATPKRGVSGASIRGLLVIDGDTLSQTNVGPGRGVAVDLTNNNYWAGVLWPTTVHRPGIIIRDCKTDLFVQTPTLGNDRDCPTGIDVDSVHRRAWVYAQCGTNNDAVWVLSADYPFDVKATIRCGGINEGPCSVNPTTGRFYHVVSGVPQRLDPYSFTQTKTTFGSIIAVNPSTGFMYASAPGRSNVLQIIDGGPDPERVLTNITLPFKLAVNYIAVDPVLGRIYVPDRGSNHILILDGKNGQAFETIALDAGIAHIDRITGAAYDGVRRRLYAVAWKEDGRRCYLYMIQDSRQRAMPIPGAGGPVLNTALNKIYVWVGPESD